jgi:hypothetical protein
MLVVVVNANKTFWAWRLFYYFGTGGKHTRKQGNINDIIYMLA